ncbi:hypothetical protein GCWU000321_00635 [Dialister invisus DSM 15470]|uniref:Uncharacterized protein n=1 Tax=Dialister invisus DSM 15470 TaxID=592028 RepID=C9LM87_9FIRM|nr:hypothetical protein GCWU000321_00635 [Dialister invisus DSM 15470]
MRTPFRYRRKHFFYFIIGRWRSGYIFMMDGRIEFLFSCVNSRYRV